MVFTVNGLYARLELAEHGTHFLYRGNHIMDIHMSASFNSEKIGTSIITSQGRVYVKVGDNSWDCREISDYSNWEIGLLLPIMPTHGYWSFF